MELHGLVSKPALNGCSAQVVGYRDGGRYGVSVKDSIIDVRVVNMRLETDFSWSDEPFHEASDIILLQAPPSPPSEQACLLKLQGAMNDMKVPTEMQGDALRELFKILKKYSTMCNGSSGIVRDASVKPCEKEESTLDDQVAGKFEKSNERSILKNGEAKESDGDEVLQKNMRCINEKIPNEDLGLNSRGSYNGAHAGEQPISIELKEKLEKKFQGGESLEDPAKELSQVLLLSGGSVTITVFIFCVHFSCRCWAWGKKTVVLRWHCMGMWSLLLISSLRALLSPYRMLRQPRTIVVGLWY